MPTISNGNFSIDMLAATSTVSFCFWYFSVTASPAFKWQRFIRQTFEKQPSLISIVNIFRSKLTAHPSVDLLTTSPPRFYCTRLPPRHTLSCKRFHNYCFLKRSIQPELVLKSASASENRIGRDTGKDIALASLNH